MFKTDSKNRRQTTNMNIKIV